VVVGGGGLEDQILNLLYNKKSRHNTLIFLQRDNSDKELVHPAAKMKKIKETNNTRFTLSTRPSPFAVPVHTLYNHQSTLYNHQSIYLPLPLLFRSVSGWLTSVHPFSHGGKVKMFVLIGKSVFFMTRKKPGIFGVPRRILRDSGT